MPLVLAFTVTFGAVLLISSAIADASFSDVLRGKTREDYVQHQQQSAAAGGASSTAQVSSTATSAGSVGAGAAAMVAYLTRNGLTPRAAAGVVGNLQQESSLNAGESGGGLAQWIGSRWTALEAFASARGLSPNSEQAQLEYLVADLHGSYASTLSAINAAASPSDAATIFSEQYERPGIPMLSNRQAYAEQAYKAAGY